MFEKAVLNPFGWHANLQKWTFGYVPYENNFCPFFWLTIFCLLVLPFTAFWRYPVRGTFFLMVNIFEGFVYVTEMLFGRAMDALEEWICKPLYEHQITNRVYTMTDDDAYDLLTLIYLAPFSDYETYMAGQKKKRVNKKKIPKISEEMTRSAFDYDNNEKKRDRILDQWSQWKNKTDNWQEKLIAIRTARLTQDAANKQIAIARKLAKKQAKIDRQKFFAALVKYTKYVFLIPIAIIGFYLTKWSIMLVELIYGNWGGIMFWFSEVFSAIWLFIVEFGPYALLMILTIGVGVGIIFAMSAIVKKCNITINIPGANVILGGFKKVGSGFVHAYEFFCIYFRTLKEDNCPSIEWKEDKE